MKLSNLISFILFNNIKHKNIITTNKIKTNYRNYIERRILMHQNIKNTRYIPCPFCHGSGFIECNNCKQQKIAFIPSPNSGCWRCSYSTFEICRFCGGSGKGKLCYNEAI